MGELGGGGSVKSFSGAMHGLASIGGADLQPGNSHRPRPQFFLTCTIKVWTNLYSSSLDSISNTE